MTMRQYTALAVVGIAAGAMLGLTGSQAARRAHLLKPVKVDPKTRDGTYEVLARTEFKIGEQFATDMDVSKSLATMLEPAEDTAKKAKDKARDAAAAKDLAALKDKAKAFDELQPELEQMRAKAAMFDALPPDVRAAAAAKPKA